MEGIQRAEREKELLSHSLADRSAELQLQMSKTKVNYARFSNIECYDTGSTEHEQVPRRLKWKGKT